MAVTDDKGNGLLFGSVGASFAFSALPYTTTAVSYTHLDVYKRQAVLFRADDFLVTEGLAGGL